MSTLYAFTYERISSTEQSQYSIPSQRDANLEYAASIGAEVVLDRYDEQTGRTINREGLQELLAAIRAARTEGKQVALIVYEQDRLNRKFVDYVNLRESLFLDGVEIHYSKDRTKVDSTAWGRLGDDLKGLLAEIEWENIAARALRGRRKKVSEGYLLASGSPPYGYRYAGVGKDRTLVIYQPEAEAVRSIFQRYVEGQSMPEIVAFLDAAAPIPAGRPGRPRARSGWATSTLYRILNRSLYNGRADQFRTRTENLVDGNARRIL